MQLRPFVIRFVPIKRRLREGRGSDEGGRPDRRNGWFPIRTECNLHSRIHRQVRGFFVLVQDGIGNDVNLGIYKGKVLLVVNVASKCGFTEKNYTQLTELYNKYKGKGMFSYSNQKLLFME
ncbi:hypothetical protein ZIOFF_075730 [Zingiber officinale]|uniref:Glutathione peroxidase n=1 Tax=Zingiber officinale TaxID=94328 RepID=A0A8J5CPY4_ZINOF|nr:hypothetical protein ZIOFF_075730 [Zingiber officinale]